MQGPKFRVPAWGQTALRSVLVSCLAAPPYERGVGGAGWGLAPRAPGDIRLKRYVPHSSFTSPETPTVVLAVGGARARATAKRPFLRPFWVRKRPPGGCVLFYVPQADMSPTPPACGAFSCTPWAFSGPLWWVVSFRCGLAHSYMSPFHSWHPIVLCPIPEGVSGLGFRVRVVVSQASCNTNWTMTVIGGRRQ